MTVSAVAAAKRLAERSGWALSNLELQKILYLAHMFHMGRNDGRPLVSGNFQAWDYGPVHPTLYHHVKVFGASPVANLFRGVPDVQEGTTEAQILDEALDELASATPGRLVAVTHRKGGAWERNYVPGGRNIVIPNEDILREYRELESAGTPPVG